MVPPGLEVVLVTSAVFSAGWLVNLDLNGSRLRGLNDSADVAAILLAQHCAGAFTTDLIQAFTTGASPLLIVEECRNIEYPHHLMPTNAATDQKLSCHEFLVQINESLAQKFTSHGSTHEVVFEREQYDWNRHARAPGQSFWSKH
jgi:hypothetical protein